MVWARLDDEILDNAKVARVGPLGFALHVAAITWCCRNLTDGFIPRARVACLLDFGELADVHALAADLVSAGLWEAAAGGFQLHDFLEFNPSREKVLKERARAQSKYERGKGEYGGGSRSSPTESPPEKRSPLESPPENAQSLAGTSDGPVPVPDPRVSAHAETLPRAREACDDLERNDPTPVASATEAPPPEPSAPRPRGGTFGLAADAWADGVRDVTGTRPPLAPWDRANLEDLARAGPAELEPCDYLRADGATFARRQRAAGMLVTAKKYAEWASSGRPEPPPRDRAGGRPELTRTGTPPPANDDVETREWLREPAPTPEEIITGAGELLAALGEKP